MFDDTNGDGIHQPDEPGIPDQALNIRFRDGSIYQSLSTDERGFKAFNEVFPFFAWMVAEVDYTRFHSTGVTVVVDDGGDASAAGVERYDWQQQAGLPTELIRRPRRSTRSRSRTTAACRSAPSRAPRRRSSCSRGSRASSARARS